MESLPGERRVRPDFVPTERTEGEEPEQQEQPVVPLPDELSLAHDRKRIKKLFDSMDRDGSGQIDSSELEEYFRRLGASNTSADASEDGQGSAAASAVVAQGGQVGKSTAATRKLTAQILSHADTEGGGDNKDNMISYQEFEAFVLEKEKELWTLFLTLDKGADVDDNGESTAGDFKVSKEELRKALRVELDLSYTEEEKFIESLMGKRTGDGMLTFPEFRDHFLLSPPAGDAHGLLHIYQYQTSLYSLTYPLFGMDMISLPLSASRAEELQGKIITAAMVSTAVARTITAPLDRIRVYWQLGGSSLVDSGGSRARRRARANKTKVPLEPSLFSQQGRQQIYKRTVQALRTISKDGGLIRGLFRGNTAALFKLPLESAVRTSALGLSRYYIAQRHGLEDYYALPKWGLLAATAMSGVIAQTAIHPLDTIRTRMMSGIERLVEGEGVMVSSLDSSSKKGASATSKEANKAASAKVAESGSVTASSTKSASIVEGEASSSSGRTKGAKAESPRAPKPEATRPMTKAPSSHPKPRSYSTVGATATHNHRSSRLAKALEARSARSAPNSFWAAAWDIARNQGFKGYYAGLGASLAAVVPFVAISDFSYEILENRYFDHNESEEGTYEPPSPLRVLYMTVTTSLFAESLLYPLQLIRSRMMAQGTKLHPYTYKSSLDCARQVWVRDGWKGFFKGIGTSALRTVPAVGVAVGSFEWLKRRVGMRWNEELGIWEDPER